MTTTTNCRTLEMEELEIVSGGTVTELDELISALEGNGVFGDICGAIGGHIPGVNKIIVEGSKMPLSSSSISMQISVLASQEQASVQIPTLILI